MISLNIFLWITSIFLSFYTAYLTYKIYSFNRLDKSWLLVTVGFFLILLLRVLNLLMGEGLFPEFFKLWYIYDPILRIMNSTCFILGFWSMLKNFENFEVVEKKVKKAIKRK